MEVKEKHARYVPRDKKVFCCGHGFCFCGRYEELVSHWRVMVLFSVFFGWGWGLEGKGDEGYANVVFLFLIGIYPCLENSKSLPLLSRASPPTTKTRRSVHEKNKS